MFSPGRLDKLITSSAHSFQLVLPQLKGTGPFFFCGTHGEPTFTYCWMFPSFLVVFYVKQFLHQFMKKKRKKKREKTPLFSKRYFLTTCICQKSWHFHTRLNIWSGDKMSLWKTWIKHMAAVNPLGFLTIISMSQRNIPFCFPRLLLSWRDRSFHTCSFCEEGVFLIWLCMILVQLLYCFAFVF